MTIDQSLREHLERLLIGRQAHVQFEEILRRVPTLHRLKAVDSTCD